MAKSDKGKKSARGARATLDESTMTQDDNTDEAPPAWLQRATERYERRQEGYASLLAGAREAVEKDKEQLSTLLQKNKAADADKEGSPPAPPPIFDEAARAYQERQKSLGGLFSDAVKAKQQEREALSKMFGDRPARKPPRR